MTDRPPRRWRRRALVAVAVLVGLVAVALGCLRLYLSPARSADLVRAEVEKIVAAPVTIESASIALAGESTLEGLSVGDYLTAERVRADVSVLAAARGLRPTRLTLEKVTLRLRFDRDGRLLTKLPPPGSGTLPDAVVHGGTVVIEQDGRESFTATGAELTLIAGAIAGKLNDPRLGPFDITGSLADTLRLTIRQDHAKVKPAELKRLPFVPPTLWDTLTASGDDVGVAVTIDVNPDVKYGVEFERAAVTLLQPDRPAFRVEGASGKLTGDAAGFALIGAVADAKWGRWAVNVAQKGTAIDVRLKTAAPVVVDAKMLPTLPFVPKAVWDNVQAEGKTPADVRVRLWTDKPDVSYRVEVEPTDVKLTVAAIDLKAEGVRGTVIVEDAVVTLEKIAGVAARGKVQTSGKLDFRPAVPTLAFAIKADGLVVSRLPERWDLPPRLHGKVSGEADIVVSVGDAVLTTGTGRGRVTEASFGLIPFPGPIDLELYADKGRLKFRTGKTALIEGMLGTILIGAAPPIPEPPPARSPAGVAGRASDGVLWLTRGVAGAAGWATEGLAQLERMTRPGVETTYLDAAFKLDAVDLVTLAQQFNVTVPEGLRGTASVDLTASIPINNARDPAAYRLNGTLSSPRLEVGPYVVEDVRATLRLVDGLAQLTGVTARVGGGSVRGDVTARLAPLGDVTFDVTAAKLSLFELLPRQLRRRFDGDVSGRIRLAAPVRRVSDMTAWRGTAAVQSGKLDVMGVPLRNTTADLTLAGGTLMASALRADLLGAMLSGRGGLNLIGDHRYDAVARLAAFDVSRVALLVPGGWTRMPVAGAVDFRGRFLGTLAGGAAGTGRATSAGLRVGNIASGPVDTAWTLAGTKVTFDQLTTTVFGAALTGRGELSPERAAVTLTLAQVDAATLVPCTPITGRINAKLTAEVAFATAGADVALDLGGSKVFVARMPVQNLRAWAVGRDGVLDYEASGDLLGGRVRVEGRYPPPPRSSVGQPHGRLKIDRVYLGRVLRAFGMEGDRGPWRGAIAIDLPFRHDGPDGSLSGNGRFEVRDLRYNDTEVADSVRGDVRLVRQGLSLRDVTGTVAGGLLRAQLSHRFDDPSRGWFNVALTGADGRRLAGVVGQHADTFTGRMDVTARGNMGPEWRGAANVRVTRGRAGGVDVGELGLPMDFTYVPARHAGEVTFRDTTAQLGGGRGRASGRVTFGDSVRVDVVVQLVEANVAALAGLTGDISGYVRGQVSGRIDIGGSEVRSADDLTAHVNLRLRDTQALELPVLRQLAPFLLLPGGRAAVFQTGEVRGRLSRGVFRIETFTMESAIVQLIIEGTVTAAGRLDLEAVARTTALGDVNPVVLRLLLGRIPAIGPVPVGVIVQATQLLADRVVRLRVTGTARTPVVQVEPLRLLSQEAARFLLTRLVR